VRLDVKAGLDIPKKQVEFFVSYAHRNHQLAENFIEKLSQAMESGIQGQGLSSVVQLIASAETL
jgi:hypothetical protein